MTRIPRMLMAGAVVCGALVLTGGAQWVSTQGPQTPEALLGAAIHQDDAEGNLEAAIEGYKTFLAQHGDNRPLAVQALLRMGQAYETLGRPEARDAYERVLRDYADQAEPVAAGRARLAALEVEPTPSSPAMSVRELMRSAELPPGEVSDPTNDNLFAVSGDGQIFAYTDWNTGDLVINHMATGEKRGLYGVEWGSSVEWIGSPVFSPDDKKVAHISYPETFNSTLRIDVDSIEGGHRETVYDFKEEGNAIGFLTAHDWSPVGDQILISGQGADRSAFLAIVSLEDKTLQRLVTLDWESPRRAEYSPDGRFIAYDSTKDGDRKIYLLSADGAEERVLVDSPGEDDSPAWTRDGRFLLFRTNRSGKPDLYALRFQNGQPTGDDVLVKSNLGAATTLRGVTTEGQLIYHELVSGRDIALTERITTPAQTSHVRILPKVGVTANRGPTFAPDGKRVAYMASTPGVSTQTIRITDLEGTILQDIPLERRFNSNRAPKFSPDGKKLAFRAYDASSGEPMMMVLSAETGTVLTVFSPLQQPGPGRGSFYHLGWSRDSRLVYVVKFEAGDTSLDLIDVETEQVVESTVLAPGFERFSLSPSGKSLLMLSRPDRFAGQERRTTRLVLRSLEDGSERLLTEESSFRFGWDFDSRHVLYMKGRWDNDENRLYSLSIDTDEETVLVEDTQDLGFPSVSPDGKYWAREKRQGEDSRILVLENFLPDNTEQTASR